MYHYAYVLEFENNMKYLGARSYHLPPHLDTTYLGSGRGLPADRKDNPDKVFKLVIAEFDTREALMAFEREKIEELGCCEDPIWYNMRKATYDRHGEEPWNKGKTVDRTKAAATFSARYKGNRTPAMIKAHAETAEKNRGVPNPDKGHKGTDNCAFNPWYYITDAGVYVEVHDTTVTDMATQLGFTYNQLVQRMRAKNAHKVAKKGGTKGWAFGVLPRP